MSGPATALDELLVADVGGTNVRFGLARRDVAGAVTVRNFALVEAASARFEDCLDAYLSTLTETPAAASFCAAGPVIDGAVDLLNSGWRLDAAAIKARWGFSSVLLVNDFAAMARAAPALGPADLAILDPGRARSGAPLVVGGPGTGFGLAILLQDGGDWRVVGGEGGHRAFAPQTEFEWQVARSLAAHLPYVSVEAVVGGKHQTAVYAAVCEVMGVAPATADPRSILPRAEAGDQVCAAVCRLRAETTLTVLGDTALLAGAFGGCMVAGGEAVRLRSFLEVPAALARFRERGPRTAYLAEVPIQLITALEAPLIGAAELGFSSVG